MNAALQLSALALAAAVLSVAVRSSRPELALPLQIAAAVLLLLAVLPDLKDTWAALEQSFSRMTVPQGVLAALCKGAAVCLITRLCAAFCKDSGNEALASVLLFAGRVGTLLPALPLVQQVLEIAQGFAQ